LSFGASLPPIARLVGAELNPDDRVVGSAVEVDRFWTNKIL